MRKIKIVSVLFIFILSFSVFAGCDIFLGSVTPNSILEQYRQMAKKYIVKQNNMIVEAQSFFYPVDESEKEFNFRIVYKETSNLNYEIKGREGDVADPKLAIFRIFDEEYPNTVTAALQFFQEYRNSLALETNDWSKDNLKAIYKALVSFDAALKEFKVQKTAIESISLPFNTETLTYSPKTLVHFNSFKQAYDNLILRAVNFNKAFEKAYVEDIAKVNQYATELSIPYYELKRMAYSATANMSEAVYHYYIKHSEGFYADDANISLYDEMVHLVTLLNQIQIETTLQTSQQNTDFYRLTAAHEKQIVSQSKVYISSIEKELALKGSTKLSDISLYNDYIRLIEEATQNYANYASYVVELINRINTN